MGMYTQYRGILCVGSIAGDEEYERIKNKLDKLKEEFKVSHKDAYSPWIAESSTDCLKKSNGSIWITILSEHKDYDSSMMDWITLIVGNIPCEGRIERQYEEVGEGENIEVMKITPRNIESDYEETHCYGYGFRGDKDET